MVNQGYRVVTLPCRDGNDVIHARCVLVTARSGGARRGAQAPLVCSERGCGARHGRREALDVAVQADPGLRDAAAALRGVPEEDDEGHRQALYCPWNHHSLGLADLLDRVSSNDAQMRSITVVKVKPNLATTHAKPITHSLGLVSHASGCTDRAGARTHRTLYCVRSSCGTSSPPSGALSGRANESDGEVQVSRTRGPNHDSPMDYGEHRRHGDTSPRASTQSNGCNQVRESRVNIPTSRGDNGGSERPSRGAARAGQCGYMDNREGKIPVRRPNLRPGSRGCSWGGECDRNRGRERPHVAPGNRISSSAGFRGHPLSQRTIKSGE